MGKYLNIEGSERILQLYGEWPSFHDSEILSVNLDRSKTKGKYGPTVTIKLHGIVMSGEIDDKGHYKTINHAQIVFQFYDVVEFDLTHGFGTQNPLVENNQGRTASYPTAPSQIPACGITAPGSSERLASHESDTVVLRNHGKYEA